MKSGDYADAEKYFVMAQEEAKTPEEHEEAATKACVAAYKGGEDPQRLSRACDAATESKLPIEVENALCKLSYQERAQREISPSAGFDVGELANCREASVSVLHDLRQQYLELIMDEANSASKAHDGAALREWATLYSGLPGADPKTASELRARAQSLLDSQAKEEAAEAAAEAPVRDAARASFCAVLLSEYQYESEYGMGPRARAIGMKEDEIRNQLWLRALTNVGEKEDFVPLIQQLATENSVSLKTSSQAVAAEWIKIARESMHSRGLSYCFGHDK